MNNTASKLVFLVVVVGVVLFSRMAYPAAAPRESERATMGANAQAAAPLFVLPPVSVSADAAGAPVQEKKDDGQWSGPNGALVFARMKDTPAPTLGTTASLLADLMTGTIFASDNADTRWPTASIAKLMSATIALDKLDPKARVYITETMFSADPSEPTLALHGTYEVGDLIDLMLLPSSNVAAEAVASFYGREDFIKEMNARADAWGMKNTHFSDPTGISAGDQSTANDLLKLAQKIYADYPKVLEVSRTPQVTVTEQHFGTKTIVKSINAFAGDADFIGGKTGHTDEAAGNLLSIFRYAKRPIVVIVLGTENRFGDTRTLYSWFTTNFK